MIKANPEREHLVNQLYKIWKESGELPHQLDIDKAWKKLSENMDDLEKEKVADAHLSLLNSQNKREKQFYQKRTFRQSSRKMSRIAISAAAAAVIIIAGLFSYYSFKDNAPPETPGKQFITKRGERATFTLSDGSKVVLYPESRLKVPAHFTGNSRDVYLKGEAYFEVDHEANHPFIVHTKNAVTREIGTKFLVQAWPKDSKVKVIVTEGKVALGSSHSTRKDHKKEIVITQNQMGVLGKNHKLSVTAVKNINQYLGWTKGQLIFNNQPLSKVIPKLERWYSVDIHLGGQSIANKKLSANINYNTQSIDEVLQGIALLLGLKVNRAGRVFTFSLKK